MRARISRQMREPLQQRWAVRLSLSVLQSGEEQRGHMAAPPPRAVLQRLEQHTVCSSPQVPGTLAHMDTKSRSPLPQKGPTASSLQGSRRCQETKVRATLCTSVILGFHQNLVQCASLADPRRHKGTQASKVLRPLSKPSSRAHSKCNEGSCAYAEAGPWDAHDARILLLPASQPCVCVPAPARVESACPWQGEMALVGHPLARHFKGSLPHLPLQELKSLCCLEPCTHKNSRTFTLPCLSKPTLQSWLCSSSPE